MNKGTWANRGKWLSVAGGIVGLVALVQPWVAATVGSQYGPMGTTKLWLWDLPNVNEWIFPGGDPTPAMVAALQTDLDIMMLGAAIVLVGSLLCILKSFGPIGACVTLAGAIVSASAVGWAHTSATIPGGLFGSMTFYMSFAPESGSVGAFLAGALGLVGFFLRIARAPP